MSGHAFKMLCILFVQGRGGWGIEDNLFIGSDTPRYLPLPCIKHLSLKPKMLGGGGIKKKNPLELMAGRFKEHTSAEKNGETYSTLTSLIPHLSAITDSIKGRVYSRRRSKA